MKTPSMLTCPQWGAKPAKTPPAYVGRPRLIVIHHTAGLAGGGRKKDAVAYARALQADMMGRRGWNDSGHNFLVMRSGLILQGRWGTVTAIEQGRMVESAHCPGENDQPGIEHEHVEGPLTDKQFQASALLCAWICWHTGVRPTQLFPHDQFYATGCPASVAAQIPALRLATAKALTVARAATV